MGIRVGLLLLTLSIFSVTLGGHSYRLPSGSDQINNLVLGRSLLDSAGGEVREEAWAPNNASNEVTKKPPQVDLEPAEDEEEGEDSDDERPGGTSSEDAPGRFVDAFLAGFLAAKNGVSSKRYKFTNAPRAEVAIKTWHEINSKLLPVLNKFISKGFGEEFIESMRPRLERKFGAASDAGASKSGATLYMLPFDEKTGSSYILKSEDRDFVKDGVMPIIKKFGAHISPASEESLGPCEKSTMMKVLFVFEPLNVQKKNKIVNKKVWMLLTNVNPIPMVAPHNNIQIVYDLKHSRPMSRCSSIGEDDPYTGYFGDFLRIWGRSLKNSILDAHARKEMMTGSDGNRYLKSTCILKAFGQDLAVLDSDYPNSKLVDQSALIVMVLLRDEAGRPRGETDAEKAIVDQSNNIFRVEKDGKKWLMVVGLIDLFANKNAQKFKKWQSYADNKHYLFGLSKFSMYPFQLGCLMQYLFYYSKTNVDHYYAAITGNNTNYLVTTDHQLCFSWPTSSPPGVFDSMDGNLVSQTLASWGHTKMTTTLHDNVKRNQACTLIKACDAVLFDKLDNFRTCCKSGRRMHSLETGAEMPIDEVEKLDKEYDADADCDY